MVALSSFFTAAVAAVLTLSVPAARAAGGCPDGVWVGTLGGTPISIALDGASNDVRRVGRYYYRASLGDLFLKQESGGDEWQETDDKGKPTGLLRLSCQADGLRGEWRSLDGSRRLPVVATPSEIDRYQSARIAALKPTVDKRNSVQNRRFDILSFGSQTGATRAVRLSGNGVGIETVNASLRKEALDAIAGHLDCKSTGLQDSGKDAGWESAIDQTVLAWNDSYVVVQTHAEGYCGGAHPWHGSTSSTYRMDSGEAVEVSTWLLPEYRKEIIDTSALWRLLMRTYEKASAGPDLAECKDAISWNASSIHAEPGKLVFETSAPYAMTPCAEDVEVPLAAIQRFLSPEGKKALSAFR